MSDNAQPPVVLVHQRREGETEVVLAGRLDISCVGRLRDAIVRASREATGQVTVDASRVSEVDPVGLRTLVACRRIAAAVGVELVLRPSPVLLSRLRRSGLHRTLTVAGAE